MAMGSAGLRQSGSGGRAHGVRGSLVLELPKHWSSIDTCGGGSDKVGASIWKADLLMGLTKILLGEGVEQTTSRFFDQ